MYVYMHIWLHIDVKLLYNNKREAKPLHKIKRGTTQKFSCNIHDKKDLNIFNI